MTFQNWQEFFAHAPQNPEKGKYFVFESAYEEEILNWLRRKDITKSQKDNFIKALIDFKDECGEFYHYRGYFLAAKFINTFKNSSFADEIVENLLSWSYNYFPQNENNVAINKKIKEEAQNALETTDINRVVKAFVNLIETTENETIVLAANPKLIELEPDNKIAISNLIKILQNTQDKKVIFQIIRSLFELPVLSKDLTQVITEILVKLLQEIKTGDDADIFWISNTFYYLRKIALRDETAINGLLQLIERLLQTYSYGDEYLCENILEVLGIIGKQNISVIEYLTKFLSNSFSDSLSYTAAKALWSINPGDLLAVDTCVHLIEYSTNSFVLCDTALFLLREEIVEFTANAGFVTKAINSLLGFIKNNQWIDICRDSISTLEKISPNNKIAFQDLCQLLDTVEDTLVSLAIAQSILHLDSHNEKALTIFHQALATTEEEWRLYNIAKNLLDIDPNNKIALDTLQRLLTTSKNEHTRLEIAKWLIKLDISNQITINTLCELIYIPRLHNSIAEKDLALSILEQIDTTNKLAIEAIEQFTKKTTDQDALIYFIKNLRRLDPQNDVAQKRLDKIIAALINSMQTYNKNDDCCLFNVAIYWRGIMNSKLLPEIVIALKPYLSNKTSANYDNYDIAFRIIWDCANRMNYVDFYRAWHQS